MNHEKIIWENTDIETAMYMARQDNEDALQALMDYFQPMFIAMYREVTHVSVPFSVDEALQASRIGLYNAISYYRDDRKMAFHNFVRLCVKREIKAWQRKEKNYRYTGGLIPMVSLDVRMRDTEELYYIENVEAPPGSADPALIIRGEQMRDEVFQVVPPDSLDGMVLIYRMMGYSYKEIAEKIGTNIKFVDNSIQRIKKIVAPLFD